MSGRAECGRGRDKAMKWEEEESKRNEERKTRVGKRKMRKMMVL